MSNHLSMAYLLSNIFTKNYWNQTTIVEIIVSGWVVSLFETQCSSFRQPHSSPSVSVLPVHAPTTSSHYVNSPLAPSVTLSLSLSLKTYLFQISFPP